MDNDEESEEDASAPETREQEGEQHSAPWPEAVGSVVGCAGAVAVLAALAVALCIAAGLCWRAFSWAAGF